MGRVSRVGVGMCKIFWFSVRELLLDLRTKVFPPVQNVLMFDVSYRWPSSLTILSLHTQRRIFGLSAPSFLHQHPLPHQRPTRFMYTPLEQSTSHARLSRIPRRNGTDWPPRAEAFRGVTTDSITVEIQPLPQSTPQRPFQT